MKQLTDPRENTIQNSTSKNFDLSFGEGKEEQAMTANIDNVDEIEDEKELKKI